jgi:hypothetical protein
MTAVPNPHSIPALLARPIPADPSPVELSVSVLLTVRCTTNSLKLSPVSLTHNNAIQRLCSVIRNVINLI